MCPGGGLRLRDQARPPDAGSPGGRPPLLPPRPSEGQGHRPQDHQGHHPPADGHHEGPHQQLRRADQELQRAHRPVRRRDEQVTVNIILLFNTLHEILKT